MRICRKKETINTDKYYTPLDECIRLVEILYENEFFTNKTDIIEPSAGSGNFVKALELLKLKYNLTFNIHAYDLEPEPQDGLNTPIIKSDFFKVNLKTFNNETTGVIGNPPFGYSCSLLRKFLKHCAKTFRDIAFIGSGNAFKWECIEYFKLDTKFIQKLNINITPIFLYEGKEREVKNSKFIWFHKQDDINPLYIKMQENLIEFSKYAVIVYNYKEDKGIENLTKFYVPQQFKNSGLLQKELKYPRDNDVVLLVKDNPEEFKTVWENSLIHNKNGGGLGRYILLNATIEEFLKNIKNKNLL